MSEVDLKPMGVSLSKATGDVQVRAVELSLPSAGDNAGNSVAWTSFDKIPEEYRIPDGGMRAWMTVVGVCVGAGAVKPRGADGAVRRWFLSAATYGAVLSFGVLEDYYVRVYMTNKTSSQISWIGSTQLGLLQLCGVVSGRLFDEGAYLSSSRRTSSDDENV